MVQVLCSDFTNCARFHLKVTVLENSVIHDFALSLKLNNNSKSSYNFLSLLLLFKSHSTEKHNWIYETVHSSQLHVGLNVFDVFFQYNMPPTTHSLHENTFENSINHATRRSVLLKSNTLKSMKCFPTTINSVKKIENVLNKLNDTHQGKKKLTSVCFNQILSGNRAA
ncbi:CLUMA_CG001084, isoform A [Clunio marinus]|uniref:CLUMA_CG001084, isoform A n=1 Tax=Clunio marinus TaxID=568069 RepID=A0A1J1HIA4_9DIPT|nr:CLUMA_CG001084, isoform A [Clunio marinus]